ncbi:MAG: Athe_2463 domain-containing protein [Acetivibrionales bacterium]
MMRQRAGNYADPSVQPGVRNWINKSLRQYGGVPLIGDIVDPEVFRYLYVESAPSLLGIGQGRMWHEYRDGSIWYQTIAIPQLTAKENLPVTAAIELLTELPENMTDVGTEMDDRELTLKFRVTGTLMDDEEHSDP